MCITFYDCPDPVLPGVYWRNDTAWELYDMATTKIILQAAEDKAGRVDLGHFTSPVYPGGARYEFDLTTMQQFNVRSGQPRPIRIIEDMNAPMYLSDADVKKMFDQARNTIVDFYTSESIVHQVVSKKLVEDGATWKITGMEMERAMRTTLEAAIDGLPPQDINPLLATAKRVESLDYISNKVQYLFTAADAQGDASRSLFKMPSEAMATGRGVNGRKLKMTLSLLVSKMGRNGSFLPTRYALLVATVTVKRA